MKKWLQPNKCIIDFDIRRSCFASIFMFISNYDIINKTSSHPQYLNPRHSLKMHETTCWIDVVVKRMNAQIQ